jgi:hypothetical protein
MTPSEHLLVLFSIVLGVGLTVLLSNFHNLIHPATRTKWHWLPAWWAINVFVSLVFWWWTMSFFGQLDQVPNFFGIMLILLGPVLLYLLASSVLPDIQPGATVDLREFYFQNRRRYFTLASLFTVVWWIQVPLFGWKVPVAQHLWAAAALLLVFTLSRTSNMKVHVALSILQGLMTMASLATAWYRIE